MVNYTLSGPGYLPDGVTGLSNSYWRILFPDNYALDAAAYRATYQDFRIAADGTCTATLPETTDAQVYHATLVTPSWRSATFAFTLTADRTWQSIMTGPNAADPGYFVDGKLAPAYIPFGTTAGTVAEGNDSRITNAIPQTTIDAKGDLLVGTADNTVARLAVGADGALAVPDSTQTSGWKFLSTRLFEGTGSPEGVVTAPPGSVFRNTESGGWNGARAWVKATGTGNTGWVVSDGDTGWVNVTPHADWVLAAAQPAFRLRRINATVQFVVRVSPADAIVGLNRATTRTLLDPIPARFAAPNNMPLIQMMRLGATAVGLGNNFASGSKIEFYPLGETGTWASNETVVGAGVWTTVAAWS